MTEFKHSRPVVLMYHRVAEPGLDPWQLCVSPSNFKDQIEHLAKNYHVLSSTQLTNENQTDEKMIVVTFDDGYIDNLRTALPILEHYAVPATFFVATHYLSEPGEFWWDELERIILSPGKLPPKIQFRKRETSITLSLEGCTEFSDKTAQAFNNWRVTYDGAEPPTPRHRIFLKLWEHLSEMDGKERIGAIRSLREWAGVASSLRSDRRPMTPSEITRLGKSPVATVGSHAISHTPLTSLPASTQLIEISNSKMVLEGLIQSEVPSIAYPHGRYDENTLMSTQNAGYKIGFGTGSAKFPTYPRHLQIPRFMVKNWDKAQFQQILGQSFPCLSRYD